MAFNYWMAASQWGTNDGPAPWPEYEKAATDILKTIKIPLAKPTYYDEEYNHQENLKNELNRYLNYTKTPEAKAEEARLARSAWESNL